MRREFKTYLWIWLALMLLLTLTCASAFVDLHGWNSAVNLLIALAKALLVALFFMQLRSSSGLVRIFAVTGLFTLALLFAVSSSDYATRALYRAPWQAPPLAPVDRAGG